MSELRQTVDSLRYCPFTTKAEIRKFGVTKHEAMSPKLWILNRTLHPTFVKETQLDYWVLNNVLPTRRDRTIYSNRARRLCVLASILAS